MRLSRVRFDGLNRTHLMRATDALASATATYAIPLLVLVTTRSTSLTGLAFMLEWIPRLAAFGFAGSLVDRFGAGRVFRTSNLVRGAVVALVGAILLTMPGSAAMARWVILAFGAVSGLLAEVSYIAVETLGAEAGRRLGGAAHRLQAAQTGIDQGAVLVGPLLGGLLLLAGPPVLMAVVALLALVAAATTVKGRSAAGDRPPTSNLLTGWRTLCRAPALAWLIGGLTAANLTSGVLQAAAPVIVVRQFRCSTAAVGAVWSAAAVASLIAVWASRRAIDRFQVWPVGVVTAAVSTIACLATALAPGFAAYTVAVAVVMAAEGAMTVVLRTLRARLIPQRGFGSTLAVTIIVILVPLPVAGALISVVPPPALAHLLLACAVLQGLALFACFTGLRRHRAACAGVFPQVRQPTATASR